MRTAKGHVILNDWLGLPLNVRVRVKVRVEVRVRVLFF